MLPFVCAMLYVRHNAQLFFHPQSIPHTEHYLFPQHNHGNSVNHGKWNVTHSHTHTLSTSICVCVCVCVGLFLKKVNKAHSIKCNLCSNTIIPQTGFCRSTYTVVHSNRFQQWLSNPIIHIQVFNDDRSVKVYLLWMFIMNKQGTHSHPEYGCSPYQPYTVAEILKEVQY